MRSARGVIKLAKRSVRAVLRGSGHDVIPRPLTPFPSDFDENDIAVCEFVKPFTGSTPERVFALRQAVKYVVQRSLLGAFVECGVYQGAA
jgi:O-methyltransferase